MPTLLVVVIRGTLAFFSLLTLARLLGKRQVSQLTFFDYVVGISIGSIAANLTVNLEMETMQGWVGLLTWAFWALVIGIVSLYSRNWRSVLDGEPTVVVQNGQILETNLRQSNYNVDDLRMQLRNNSVFSMADVEFAVLEPNGKLSVLKKSQLQPVTPGDLHIATTYKGLAVELIVDGHILEENLKQLDLSQEWLIDKVKERNIAIEDVYYAELDTSGNLYIDLRDDLDKLPEDQDITDK